MKMRKLLLLFPLVIAACAAPTQPPEPEVITVEVTATSQPTETPKSLTYLDLEPLLFQSGDLPTEFAKGVVSEEIPNMKLFHELPESSSVTTLEIDDKEHTDVWGDRIVGNRVVVLTYGNNEDRDAAYSAMYFSSSLGEEIEDLPNLGLIAAMGIDPEHAFITQFQHVVFVRCNMVVYITTTGNTINYAKRLDGRLSKEFCP